MATEEGIVCKTDATTAWITTTRSSACESCASKKSCNTLGSATEMEVQAVNTAGAQVGDRVVISFETASLFKLSFLLYIFPILAMFAGALLGQTVAPYLHVDATILSVVCGFLFFGLAFGLIRLRGNRLAQKDEYRPRVIRILKRS
ncbi:MAG: SoxR reducing system RseC family protein [Thermodesulfobacteriota bacterium]